MERRLLRGPVVGWRGRLRPGGNGGPVTAMTFNLPPLPPVSPALAGAVAAAPTIPSTWEFEPEGATEPDFATMFTGPDHVGPVVGGECATGAEGGCLGCEYFFTPRMAWLVYAGAQMAVDLWREANDYQGDSRAEAPLEGLPPVAQRYGATTPGWFGQMAATIRDISLRVAAGQVPYPTSTAEEMALHIALEQGGTFIDLFDDEGANWTSFERLPVHAPDGVHEEDLCGALDDGLDALSDVLFEDHDVLLLFNPAMDGLESDPEMADRMGLVNLHPKDWFIPFRSERALDVTDGAAAGPVSRGRGGMAHDVVDAVERHGLVVATLDSPERAKKFCSVVKSVAGRRSVRFRSSTVCKDGAVQVSFRAPERTATVGSDEPAWGVQLGALSDEVLFGGWVF